MAIRKTTRRRIHRAYDRYEKNLLNKYTKDIKKFLDKQSERISAAIKKKYDKKEKISKEDAEKEATKVFDDSYSIENDIKELQTTLFPLILSAGQIGNDLANILLYASEEQYQLFSIIEPKYLKFLDKHGLEMSKSINETSRKRSIRIIRDGIIEGQSYADIATNLVSELKEQNIARAQTIVETEIHTSFMTARNLNATEGGFKEKHWLSSRDKAVRPSHTAYDNEGWVKMNHTWNGMKYPGDPSGPSFDTIRCRCDVSYR